MLGRPSPETPGHTLPPLLILHLHGLLLLLLLQLHAFLLAKPDALLRGVQVMAERAPKPVPTGLVFVVSKDTGLARPFLMPGGADRKQGTVRVTRDKPEQLILTQVALRTSGR